MISLRSRLRSAWWTWWRLVAGAVAGCRCCVSLHSRRVPFADLTRPGSIRLRRHLPRPGVPPALYHQCLPPVPQQGAVTSLERSIRDRARLTCQCRCAAALCRARHTCGMLANKRFVRPHLPSADSMLFVSDLRCPADVLPLHAPSCCSVAAGEGGSGECEGKERLEFGSGSQWPVSRPGGVRKAAFGLPTSPNLQRFLIRKRSREGVCCGWCVCAMCARLSPNRIFVGRRLS